MIDPEIIQKIKRLRIRANYLVNDIFAGEYKSAFKGRGMEFEEIRPYQTGDDTRDINWKITARFGYPFVKTYREERELTVMIMVDISSSGHFGTRRCLKQELAVELAATLAYTAAKCNDRVGLILFSEKVETCIHPGKGHAHAWNVVRELVSCGCGIQRRGTDITIALNYLIKILRRRSVCFIISDFLDEGFEAALSTAAQKHQIIALVISDKREEEIPPLGLMTFQDAETGEMVWVNTRKPGFQEKFQKQVRIDRKNLTARMRASRTDIIQFATEQSIISPLLKYFRMRGQRTFGL